MAYESESTLSTGLPNNSTSTANLLTLNEQFTAALGSATDVDYFKIVTSGASLIELAFESGLSSTDQVWSLALLDSQGLDYLRTASRSAAGSPQVDGADQRGTTLLVDGLSAAPAAGDRFTIATSGADSVIYTVVSSTTPSAGAATITLDKSLAATPADDAYLIFDPVQSATGSSTTLEAQVSSAGTYYLKVAKGSGVFSSADYGITASVIATTEAEDNDDKLNARDSGNRLLEGVAMSGNLSDANDVDVWLFTTAIATDFNLAFAAAGGSEAEDNWSITLQNWDGVSINNSTGSAISLSAGTSASASITDEINPTAQTYVVTVAATDSGVNTGTYTLTLSGSALDLNDTPVVTMGEVTSATSGALTQSGLIRSLAAGESGQAGTPISLSSLFSASDADSGQSLSYLLTLESASSGGSSGYIRVGETDYGFGTGMSDPTGIELTAAQIASALFYPGESAGDMTLSLQAKDSSGADDGSDLGAIMQMTLRIVSAGYRVNVTADESVTLTEGDDGSRDTLEVTLGAAPAAGETVSLYLGHGSERAGEFELDFSSSVLTFNSDNWGTPQSVTITARDDYTKESSQLGQVSFQVVSSDENSAFNDLAIDSLSYNIQDAPNHAPTGSVTISGTATQGQMLTTSNDLADVEGLGTLIYNWQQSSDGTVWSTIAGSGTSSSYTLGSGTVGKQVRVVVSYTDGDGNSELVASSALADGGGNPLTIANINDAPTLSSAIADQSAIIDRLFNFTLPIDTFSDVDPAADGGTLSYSAQLASDNSGTLSGDGTLPDWLSFDSSSRTFSSSSVSGSAGDEIYLKVTATDNATPSLSVSDTFKVTLQSAAMGTPVLALPLVDQSATEDSAFSYTIASGSFSDTDNSDGSSDTSAALTYSANLASGDELPVWLSFNSDTLTFSGTPLNDDVGTLAVRLTASDGSLSVSDIFNVTIANSNDQPTGSVSANSASVAVTQGNLLTAQATLSDEDGLGSFSYQWQRGSDSDSSGSVDESEWSSISGAAATTYRLTQSDVGKMVRVQVSYTDGGGTVEQVNSSATSAVTNINDTPTAVADNVTAVEAGGVSNGSTGTDPSGNLLSNDSDVDGDTISVTAIGGGTLGEARAGNYGSLTLNADGSFSYSVNQSNAAIEALLSSDTTLTDTFNYTIADSAGLTSSSSVTVTIQGASDAPVVENLLADVATSDANNPLYAGSAWQLTVAEDTFSDRDQGDTLSYSAQQVDSEGAPTTNSGALPDWLTFDSSSRTFHADGSQSAGSTVYLEVTATDSAGLSVSDTFSVAVADPGTTAPTLAAVTAVALSDTAADDSFSPSSGTLVGAVGSGSSSNTTALVYGISGGTDDEGSTTVTKSGSYGTLTVTKADGSYSFVPNATAINALAAAASESFIVTVTDSGNSQSASRQLAINLTATDDTPLLQAPAAATFVDTTAADTVATLNSSATNATGTLSGSDAEGSTPTYGIDGGSDAGETVTLSGNYTTLTLNKSSGAYTLSPNATAINALGFDTTERYTVTVSDGASSDEQSLTVNLTAANDSAINEVPKLTTIATLTAAATEDQPYSISYATLTAAADEQDIETTTGLSFRIAEVLSGTLTKNGVAVTAGTTTIGTGETVIWTPAENVNGDAISAFTLRAFDGNAASVTPVAVKVNVTAVADLPISSGAITATAIEAGVASDGSSVAGSDATGSAGALLANALDPDDANVTFTLVGAIAGGATSGFSAVNAGSTSTSNGTTVNGSYGALTVGADGSYHYALDQTNSTLNGLTTGETLTEQFTLQLQDSATTPNTLAQSLHIVIDGHNESLPTSSSGVVSGVAESPIILTVADFGSYSDGSDAEVRDFSSIKVTTLPTAGSLQYAADGTNWTPVTTIGAEISVVDIEAGQLRFVPASGGVGSGYATIGFQVGDGTGFSADSYTLQVDISSGEGYSLSGTVRHWRYGETKLDGVVLAIGDTELGSSGSDGTFDFSGIADDDGNVTLSGTMTPPETLETSGITLQGDVLSALRIAFDMPLLDQTAVSTYNYIAADFDGDGDVELQDDVLALLRYAFDLPVANDLAPTWAFVDAADLIENDHIGSTGQALSFQNSSPHPIDQDLSADSDIELIGILRGDVDGSWGEISS